MKRKSVLFLLLLCFIFGSDLVRIENVKADPTIPYIVHYFETDKDLYYKDECIKINASWYLNYSESFEIASMEVKMADQFNNITWASEKFYQTGTIEKNWTLSINDLNLSFTGEIHKLKVKLIYYSDDTINGGYSVPGTPLEEIEVDILKKNVTYEILSYEEMMKYGNSQPISIRFLDSLNFGTLQNIPIRVSIVCNKTIISSKNLTTNSNGTISWVVSTYSDLNIGSNTVEIFFGGNLIYNNLSCSLNIFVEKSPVELELKRKDMNVSKGENYEMEFQYYYLSNNLKVFLNGESVKVEVFRKNISLLSDLILINEKGILLISLPYTILEAEEEPYNITIKLTLNETECLKAHNLEYNSTVDVISENQNTPPNKSPSLFNPNKYYELKRSNFNFLFYVLFCSSICLTIIIGRFIVIRGSSKRLSEIYFKY